MSPPPLCGGAIHSSESEWSGRGKILTTRVWASPGSEASGAQGSVCDHQRQPPYTDGGGGHRGSKQASKQACEIGIISWDLIQVVKVDASEFVSRARLHFQSVLSQTGTGCLSQQIADEGDPDGRVEWSSNRWRLLSAGVNLICDRQRLWGRLG